MEKELNRCLPCYNCGEKPQYDITKAHNWSYFGCSCNKYFLGYLPSKLTSEHYADYRKRWNRKQRGSDLWYPSTSNHYNEACANDTKLRNEGVDRDTRDLIWKATVAHAFSELLHKKEANERAHGRRMADLAHQRKLKIQELQSKIQKLEAQLEKQKKCIT